MADQHQPIKLGAVVKSANFRGSLVYRYGAPSRKGAPNRRWHVVLDSLGHHQAVWFPMTRDRVSHSDALIGLLLELERQEEIIRQNREIDRELRLGAKQLREKGSMSVLDEARFVECIDRGYHRLDYSKPVLDTNPPTMVCRDCGALYSDPELV